MSKRIYSHQYGERKKARLDISITDHNFPLSQSAGTSSESGRADTWGDDNDDEMLLLASQVCEQEYNSSNISTLPDYSMCMQPGSTSTQLYNQPGPSQAGTSKSGFIFKQPNSSSVNTVSTFLKEKCDRISSPLPGISSKVTKPIGNISEDLIFNDKIYKGQDAEVIYKQLLQLQEENGKLKLENCKLLEKCVTKEGESSILRTQLKSAQLAVDNARMEKIRAQEKTQMEWMEKLTAANNEMHNLRTQLDFKNLEIISVKERCKMLESSKVKLTQVTVATQDIYISNKHNNSQAINDLCAPQHRKVRMCSNAVQTDIRAAFMKLNKAYKIESSNLSEILPSILEPTEATLSLLEYHDSLQRDTELQNKCNIFSTFHRLPDTSHVRERSKNKFNINCIYEDLTYISAGSHTVLDVYEKYLNIINTTRSVLNDVQLELELISQRVSTAFQREMDDRYMDCASTFLAVDKLDLIKGRALYKEEQAILLRRMLGVVAHITLDYGYREVFVKLESVSQGQFLESIRKICDLLDTTSCAVMYSGFLLSVIALLRNLMSDHKEVIMRIIKLIIKSRPMCFVSCEVLSLLRQLAFLDSFMAEMCPGDSSGSLTGDNDLDSCILQMLLKQIETSLKCVERERLPGPALNLTRNLIGLRANLNTDIDTDENKACNCELVLTQTVLYALRICAVMLKNCRRTTGTEVSVDSAEVLFVCRSGVRCVYRGGARGARGAQPGPAEGHLQELCDVMNTDDHTACGNILSELTATFQTPAEDTPPSYHREAWMNSFQAFSLAD